ncbi:PAN domain-containing protein [Aphelenchoides avenae]|nr:PAN domain-containing protein [Aphelenchus avenae]
MLLEFLCSLVALIVPALAASSSCFYLPNIALSGGTYDEIATDDISQCCIKCARTPCCIAYTYDKVRQRCYMKSAISDSYKTRDMTSGIKANAHSGQGATLRNVKIGGGTASAVRLPNSEECMQYCTAYGIFSWSPPGESADEPNGECSCMSRIASLEYSFGAKSAIFPGGSSLNN